MRSAVAVEQLEVVAWQASDGKRRGQRVIFVSVMKAFSSGPTKRINRSNPGKLVLALLALLFLVGPYAQVEAQMTPGRPRLVVCLIADEFNYDYLVRFQDRFGAGGLKLLLDGGANFTNCQYQQASNQTASGQAIIATGSSPWANGIIADRWYDHRKAKLTTATAADDSGAISGGTGGSSHNLNGTTFTDQIKLATNGRGKVITVGLTEAPPLILAGKLANAAYWWDTRTGSFVGSSQFVHDLPGWAKTFNDSHYADKYFGKPWNRLLAETQYLASTRDDYPHERPYTGDGRQFPHVISGGAGSPNEVFYGTFAQTPFGDQMVADFAKEAVDHESLGMHVDPDFLGVNFSATEAVGNAFGPNSQEMQDAVLRLDQSIASLLHEIDTKVGLNNCLIVFTADHGVAPIPELLRERGIDSGRIEPSAIKAGLSNALSGRLAKDDWVSEFQPPNLYLNLNTIDRLKYRQPDVEALAAKLAHSLSGVGEVYTAAQFFLNEVPNGPLSATVRRSYYWGRSGELIILPKPGYVFTPDAEGTSAGSPFSYDAQVPLIFYGGAVRSGRYGTTCSPIDIAPTISAVLGVDCPTMTEGRALHEALGQVNGPPTPRASFTGQ
jgi:predicted AlkP superfamily pyrophosphatase or phosphodiesterase